MGFWSVQREVLTRKLCLGHSETIDLSEYSNRSIAKSLLTKHFFQEH